jgi:lysyl-tRNA synthetase class 2
VNDAGLLIAERFELYFGKIELANGFHELTDAKQQRNLFERDLEKRGSLHKTELPVDENLLAALTYGLPNCAGVALGLDRWQMVIGKHDHISEVVCFDDQHA